jgi:hypothetical protein
MMCLQVVVERLHSIRNHRTINRRTRYWGEPRSTSKADREEYLDDIITIFPAGN